MACAARVSARAPNFFMNVYSYISRTFDTRFDPPFRRFFFHDFWTKAIGYPLYENLDFEAFWIKFIFCKIHIVWNIGGVNKHLFGPILDMENSSRLRRFIASCRLGVLNQIYFSKQVFVNTTKYSNIFTLTFVKRHIFTENSHRIFSIIYPVDPPFVVYWVSKVREI